MQILTDRGADLDPDVVKEYDINFASLRIMLDGKVYESGADIDGFEFYKMLGRTNSFPTTSQPSVGEFQELYEKLAQKDPDIFSIHISSGLSGTFNSAKAGAALVNNANITLWDTMTLSCPEGWQVETAAKMFRKGRSIQEVQERLKAIQAETRGIFTLDDLRYLIHGGRISHIQGLVASLLNIKPIIGVDKVTGKYFQLGRFISMNRAIQGIVKLIREWHGDNEPLRIQLLHGDNLSAVEKLKEYLSEAFDCEFDKTLPIAAVLGAHTGPTMVGLSVGPRRLFADL